jgi:hypothetical protein
LFSGAHIFEIKYLLIILMYWNARSDGQNIGLGTRFVLVVKPHRAVGPKVIGVSGCRGIVAFDAVLPRASYDFALAVNQ